MPKPSISIALTTYNGERFLRKQLESIFSQTVKPFEIIASDDHSADSTVTILKEYEGTCGLKIFTNERNIGFAKNFEQAILKCSGKYIALSDQDDIWMPNKIERLVESIKDSPLVFSDASYIDENDKLLARSVRQYRQLPLFEELQLENIVYCNYAIGCTVLFNRSVLEKAIPFPSSETFHDWWLAMASCSISPIKYLDDSLVLYRKHTNNTLGLQVTSSLKEKLNILINNTIDKPLYNNQKKRLLSIVQTNLFNSSQRDFLLTAIKYYDNRLQKPPHWKAFLIALKYRRLIFPNVSNLWMCKALLGTLIR